MNNVRNMLLPHTRDSQEYTPQKDRVGAQKNKHTEYMSHREDKQAQQKPALSSPIIEPQP